MLRGRPDLLRFVAARVLGGMAMQMTATALGWLVYARTHSAYALGLVALFQFIPAIPLVAATGHVADNFDRRWVVSAALMVQIAAAAAFFAFDRSSLGMAWLYALVLVIGGASAFGPPAQQSLLATLVPGEEISQAVAFSSSTNQLAVMVGPALGGVAFAWTGAWTFVMAAGLQVVALVLMLAIKPRPITRDTSGDGVWAKAFAGLAYVKSNPILLGAITLDLFAVILAGVTSLLPIFARDILHSGPIGLGALRSAPAIGALAVGFVLSRWPIQRRAGLLMIWAVGAGDEHRAHRADAAAHLVGGGDLHQGLSHHHADHVEAAGRHKGQDGQREAAGKAEQHRGRAEGSHRPDHQEARAPLDRPAGQHEAHGQGPDGRGAPEGPKADGS